MGATRSVSGFTSFSLGFWAFFHFALAFIGFVIFHCLH
jgi:hypothetical protein